MTIPDEVLLIAGYVLAHAAYSVSDLESGDLLIPLAVTQTGNNQEVIRFEAKTQAEAIANAKSKLEQLQGSVDIYAFAREDTMRQEDGSKVDVISVDAWEKGLKHKVAVVQPFHPNNGNGEFKILPGIMIIVDGETLDKDIEKRYIEIVEEGITYHPVGNNWNKWKNQPI